MYISVLYIYIYTHTHTHTHTHTGFPSGPAVKNLLSMQGDPGNMEHGFDLWVRKSPWRRKWQPTPVFLPGKSHGQRSLAGYSSRSHKRVAHDLATEQKTNTPFVATWMDLKINILSEVRERQISYDITSMWNLKNYTNELIYRTETDSQT